MNHLISVDLMESKNDQGTKVIVARHSPFQNHSHWKLYKTNSRMDFMTAVKWYACYAMLTALLSFCMLQNLVMFSTGSHIRISLLTVTETRMVKIVFADTHMYCMSVWETYCHFYTTHSALSISNQCACMLPGNKTPRIYTLFCTKGLDIW